MRDSVVFSIYQGITGNHWVDIHYSRADKDGNKKVTFFEIGVVGVNPEERTLIVDVYNYRLLGPECDVLESRKIYFDNILDATVIEQSFFDTPTELLNKIDSDEKIKDFLQISYFDNNILSYLSECNKYDKDACIKKPLLINGVDCKTLLKQRKYKLDDEQFALFLSTFFSSDIYDAEKESSYVDIAINEYSIFIRGKMYNVAYRIVTLNFKDHSLRVDKTINFNKSFLFDDNERISITRFIDTDPVAFCDLFIQNPRDAINSVEENFRYGERTDTTPTLFLLERKLAFGVNEALNAISELEQENKFQYPLKSFFGRNRATSGLSKDFSIVIYDKKKVNIDQIRVIANAMSNHVTYVKGPPGTGKTETIFNVLLSAYCNSKTVLVCSNNNHPLNDIFDKMHKPYIHKDPNTGEGEEFFFPILRLGSRDEVMPKAILMLRECFNVAAKKDGMRYSERATKQQFEKLSSNYAKLKELISLYEMRLEIKEKAEKLVQISKLTTEPTIKAKALEQIQSQHSKINEIGYISDYEATELVISAKDNKAFMNYLYYSSMAKLAKLNRQTYDDLREIVFCDDIDEGVSKLLKYVRDDASLKKLLDVFPIIVSTNLSAANLGNSRTQSFDLCVMDESGQCNITQALISIVRSTNLLLVGDPNQLQPITVIDNDINNRLMEKYGVKKEYNYVKNSILTTMLSKDNNSKVILLSYHYRCSKNIVTFVNQRYYENELKLKNLNPGTLKYINVKNAIVSGTRNAYNEEAKQIAKFVHENKYNDIGIITPFNNQADLINYYLDQYGVDKSIRADTIHSLQGSQKKIIVMSAALSPKTMRRTMDWIKDNHELINVGVTRAQEMFVFVGDKEAIDLLSGNDNNDIKALSDYIYTNGEIVVPKSDKIFVTNFSNNSESEKLFFETVQPFFNGRDSKFQIIDHVKVRDALPLIDEKDEKLFGNKEFDFIVKAPNRFSGKMYTIVAFEVDGGEHIGTKKAIERDIQKKDICKRHQVALIRIANSEVRDYQLIIQLFESIVKDIKDIDEANSINLLEEVYE